MLAQDRNILFRAKIASVFIVHRGVFFQASTSLRSAHDFPIPSEAEQEGLAPLPCSSHRGCPADNSPSSLTAPGHPIDRSFDVCCVGSLRPKGGISEL
jgi:hypothetical protein